MIPPWVRPESPETIRLIDDATVAFQPAFGRGTTQRGIFADPRWGIHRRYRGLRSDEKAAVLSCLNESRGQLNILRITPHSPIRGSFPTSELITNNSWANGTTGWTADSQYSLTVSDRVARLMANGAISTGITIYPTSVMTCVQYAPYVARWMLLQGRGAYSTGFRVDVGSTAGGGEYGSSGSYLNYGLASVAVVPNATTISTRLEDLSNNITIQGDYVRVPYVSLARCALVDNSPNLALQSDSFATTWTQSSVTVLTDNTAGPTGAINADAITETSSTSTHELRQSYTVLSSALDYCQAVIVKANARSQIVLAMEEATGSSDASVQFNISAGTVGTATNGANWSGARGFIVDMGGGYFFCAMVARKTNAATSILQRIMLHNGTSTSYAGNNAVVAVYLWRAGFAQSGVPLWFGQTTSSASTGTVPTGGTMRTKGWPASTNGLLLSGDWIEINGELKQLVAPVNSDAAGLAYLQFRPGLAGSPADNDPIVVYEPFGRFIYPQGTREISNLFGIYSDCEMDLEEIYA